MIWLARLRLLTGLALQSVRSHKAKSLVVGSIVLFGTALLVVGLALLDSVERSMERSVTASLAGHVQVYSADARDPLALFGGAAMGAEDIGELDDFAPVKKALSTLPGVEAVVPMGITLANASQPGDLDRLLQRLRDAVRAEDQPVIRNTAQQVREIATDLLAERERSALVMVDESLEEERKILDRVTSQVFWEDFAEAPVAHLEWLDTKLAPLGAEGDLIYVRLLGTDLDLFARSFDRFRMVEGERPPPGRRGLLVSKLYWDQMFQNPVARDLDLLLEGLAEGRSLAEDGKQERLARKLPGQYDRIVYQLDPEEAGRLESALAEAWPQVKGALVERVKAFLTVDDENLEERHRFFHDVIAPMIDLHFIRIGDVLTLRSYTKSGYVRSVNVPVWGVFTFEGLEGAELAGAQNLVDLVTFRELYGRMSARGREELAEIREAVGAEDVSRDEAEAALFGGGDLVEDDAEARRGFDEFEAVDLSAGITRGEVDERVYSQDELDQGLVLNAAVILADGGRVPEAIAAIRKISEAQGLGLQAVDWQAASGIVGQMIALIRVVLYIAIFIIFAVALVIINNSMIIATMERVGEIGTLRAIGAQRSFVMVMFLVETLVLCLLAGGAGALLGAGVIGWLGRTGISAGGEDVLVFLFSGPRLYPEVGLPHLAIGFAAILLVTVVSTLYPARVATRIQPVVAMQGGEQ